MEFGLKKSFIFDMAIMAAYTFQLVYVYEQTPANIR